MIDTLLALVPDYGAWLMLVATFCSCPRLANPGVAADADGGGLCRHRRSGPDLGGGCRTDRGRSRAIRSGFHLGRTGGNALLQRIGRDGARAAVITKASESWPTTASVPCFSAGGCSAPLGPWVNLAAGAVGLRWLSFTLAGVAGEALWVAVYVGPGYYFASNISDLADTMGAMLAFWRAGVLALGLGIWLVRSARASHPAPEASDQTNIA